VIPCCDTESHQNATRDCGSVPAMTTVWWLVRTPTTNKRPPRLPSSATPPKEGNKKHNHSALDAESQ
ncbi:MAG: hypothetical protein M9898_15020, partial [Chitinophagaceae bacterium]|nr:hypothetical protein [Chitinophagaceae bacterium]